MDLAFDIIDTARNELLLFSAIWLLIGGLDDICIDLIWLGRRYYRRRYYRNTPPLMAHQLAPSAESGLLAVFIPVWGEAAVIGAMLDHMTRSWENSGFPHRIYVGCYPNDPDSIAAVLMSAAKNHSIRLILVGHNGPTTKADCLNRLWLALLSDEIAGGYKAKAIILHDAEDAVHRDELLLFDRLLGKGGAIQLPVIPVRTVGSAWVSGHYCDEFAEAHAKTLVVREALGAALPLAGVACAIDRQIMGRIALREGGRPFDESSLTEDYELGLRIGAVGGRTIMARVFDRNGDLVGTRACFPDSLNTSVRQKTRWLTGIALAGWDRIGWQGNWAQKWMLVHDRRPIFAAIVLLAAYLAIALTAILEFGRMGGFHQSERLPGYLIGLLFANAAILLWRLSVRAAFVGGQYGAAEALLSVPRCLIANIIAIMAARRACVAYVRHCFGRPLTWDKTTHYVVPGQSSRPD